MGGHEAIASPEELELSSYPLMFKGDVAPSASFVNIYI